MKHNFSFSFNIAFKFDWVTLQTVLDIRQYFFNKNSVLSSWLILSVGFLSPASERLCRSQSSLQTGSGEKNCRCWKQGSERIENRALCAVNKKANKQKSERRRKTDLKTDRKCATEVSFQANCSADSGLKSLPKVSRSRRTLTSKWILICVLQRETEAVGKRLADKRKDFQQLFL